MWRHSKEEAACNPRKLSPEPNHVATLILDSQPLKLWDTDVCSLIHPVCGIHYDSPELGLYICRIFEGGRVPPTLPFSNLHTLYPELPIPLSATKLLRVQPCLDKVPLSLCTTTRLSPLDQPVSLSGIWTLKFRPNQAVLVNGGDAKQELLAMAT